MGLFLTKVAATQAAIIALATQPNGLPSRFSLDYDQALAHEAAHPSVVIKNRLIFMMEQATKFGVTNLVRNKLVDPLVRQLPIGAREDDLITGMHKNLLLC